MSDEPNHSPNKGLVAQIIGSTSFLTAVLIYMGWAYQNAVLAYFRVPVFSLNLSVVDYGLHSLGILLTVNVIFTLALVVVVVAGSQAPAVRRLVPPVVKRAFSRVPQVDLMIYFGFLITIAAGLLSWFGTQSNGLANWFISNPGVFYLVVGLLGLGLLLFTWPVRDRPYGHFIYPLAIVAAAACFLWATGLYANNLGIRAAHNIAGSLPTQTAVDVYSVQSLALSGPGVHVQHLRAESFYHYRYYGLRLLLAESSTYYLLPVGWSHEQGHTYILNGGDQIRIELSRGS